MSILIIGSGICGLGTALLLARDRHEVTVLEQTRDLYATPDCDPRLVVSSIRKDPLADRTPSGQGPELLVDRTG